MTGPVDAKALSTLQEALKTQPEWIKVHAAEYLLWAGYPQHVKTEFLHEHRLHYAASKYRIGIWRVLAQEETRTGQRKQWIDKIFEAFADRHGSDQLHALETLAKLKLSPLAKYPEATRCTLTSDNKIFYTYALWATAYASDDALETNRKELLNLAVSDANERVRKISAFGLRKVGALPEALWGFLTAKALSEPAGSGVRNYLLNTAFVLQSQTGETETSGQIKAEMLKNHAIFSFEKRIDLSLSLAAKGTMADLPVLQFFMDDGNSPGMNGSVGGEEAEVRIAAAFAILRIKQSYGASSYNVNLK